MIQNITNKKIFKKEFDLYFLKSIKKPSFYYKQSNKSGNLSHFIIIKNSEKFKN